MTGILKRCAAVCVGALAVSCASAPVPESVPPLAEPGRRITDEAIVADYRAFDAVERRLQALNAAGVPLRDYRLARALALLDFAFDEYHENDRSDIVALAVREASRLAADLEANRPSSPTQGSIERGEPARKDLWQLAELLKAHPNFACTGGGGVAKLEVALMHADHEWRGGGWRRARPQIEIAEALAREARRAIEECAVR
jgi:OOP family OmpA-OmpF porin